MTTAERKQHYIDQARAVGGKAHAEAMRITLEMMLENPAVITTADVWAWARQKLRSIADQRLTGEQQ
jgi:hypothetical protein